MDDVLEVKMSEGHQDLWTQHVRADLTLNSWDVKHQILANKFTHRLKNKAIVLSKLSLSLINVVKALIYTTRSCPVRATSSLELKPFIYLLISQATEY